MWSMAGLQEPTSVFSLVIMLRHHKVQALDYDISHLPLLPPPLKLLHALHRSAAPEIVIHNESKLPLYLFSTNLHN
jgi:hypothetical protein